MKIIPFVLFSYFILSACSPQPDAIIRVDCGEFNNKGLQASVNGQNVGECPVDLSINSGNIEISARKDNEDASYLFAERKMTLAENAMKRIKLDIQPVYTEEFYFRKSTDLAGAENYLKNVSESPRRSSVEALKEKFVYESVSDQDGLKRYLALYPSGEYFQIAKDKLEELVFSTLKTSDDVDAFIKNHPNSKLNSKAVERLNELKAEELQKLKLAQEKKEKIEKEQAELIKKKWANAGFFDNRDGTATHIQSGLIVYRCQYPKVWNSGSCKGVDEIYHTKDFLESEYPYKDVKLNYITFAGRDDWIVVSKGVYSSLCNNENIETLINIFPDLSKGKCVYTESSRFQIAHLNEGSTKSYIFLMRIPKSIQELDILTVEKLGYKYNGDGTLTDKKNGLMWTRCPGFLKLVGNICVGSDLRSFYGVRDLLAGYALAGHNDWRMPTVQEIKTILVCREKGFDNNGFCRKEETQPIDSKLFPYSIPSGIWSSEASKAVCRGYNCGIQVYPDGRFSDTVNLLNYGDAYYVRSVKN